eukprot:jgi/Ulvmu1/1880/UM012_0037.1
MSGKPFVCDSGSAEQPPSLAAQSNLTAATSFSEPSQAPSDIETSLSKLADVLFQGEREHPYFCFHHLSHYLKDSVVGHPSLCLSNGPHYQVEVLKGLSVDAVRKRLGAQDEHTRALCWEALMLSVLAVLRPFIIPALQHVVCPTPAGIQIIQERCSGAVHKIASLQAPHPRLADLSQPGRSGPPVPFADAIPIMFHIALALSAAHTLNSSHSDHPGVVALALIHGNVHPGNILLRASDKLPVVCGWSHSMLRWRATDGTQHVFSAAEVPDDPYHNAPELQAAEDPTAALRAHSDRADVWGFALVSFFLLTGLNPYHGKRLTQVTRARDAREPPYDAAAAAAANSELAVAPGRGVLSLLRHCLADDPEERPSMRQCALGLAPLAARFLQKTASELLAAAQHAQGTVKALQEKLSKQSISRDTERSQQEVQHAAQAASLPTYVAENVAVCLADLCAQAAKQERPDSFVLNLGSRPVSAIGASAPRSGPGGRYRLPCGVRGGVFQLLDGDVLSIFGTRCADVHLTRAAAATPPPLTPLAPGLLAEPPRDAPRVAFFGERVTVSGVTAAECVLSVSAAAALVENCRVTGAGEGVGLEVVEARGDPEVRRRLVLRGCEVTDCRLGLLVKGVSSDVKVEDCRFRDCREHNMRLQKIGTRAGAVELERVHATGAARCGLVVETLCSARCVECTLQRNGHYGVQVLPKAVVRLARCALDHNRRGKTSGNGIFLEAP